MPSRSSNRYAGIDGGASRSSLDRGSSEGRVGAGIVRALLVLGLALSIYVFTYVTLSLSGAYAISQTGAARFTNSGQVVNDVSVWRPKFLRLKISLNERGGVEREANLAGWFFYPLELVDRRYWHPTKNQVVEMMNGFPALPPPHGDSAF